ncbi:MAG: hypothetical protein R3D98_01155 [Candidatus Krumholzibacteriia bacterium]
MPGGVWKRPLAPIPVSSDIERMGLGQEPVACFAPQSAGALSVLELWWEVRRLLGLGQDDLGPAPRQPTDLRLGSAPRILYHRCVIPVERGRVAATPELGGFTIMRTTFGLVLALALGATLGAVSASAQFISAPETVIADSDGFFLYNVTVSLFEPMLFGLIDVDGTDNTDLTWSVEEPCDDTWPAGVYTTGMGGHLVDLSQNGTVVYHHVMCDEWNGTVTTTIIAPSVATENVSWSSLKGLYR